MSRKNAKILVILAGIFTVSAILLLLTRVIPISPDEYFYSNASLSVYRSLNYFVSMNSINTEHTSSLVLLASLFISVFKTNSIYFLRLLIALISIGTLYIYIQIIRQKLNIKESYFVLSFLFLIPGYFYASAKFILEIPAAFTVALFALLLIKKKNSLVIGFSLALILFTKEYYFFLIAPIAVIVLVCDRISSDIVWRKKVIHGIADIAVVLLPSVLLSLLLIDFNIGPYPRMLENTWKELMQGGFSFLNKNLYFVVEPIAKIFRAANQQLFLVVDYLRGSPGYHVSHMTGISDVSSKIYNLDTSGSFFSKAIIESPILVGDTSLNNLNLFRKIWLIYKYNLPDQEISTVELGLTIFGGVAIVGATIKNLVRKYSEYRFDFIMVLFSLLFLFFNYQQAANIHGFRLNIPITFVLVYFSYLGFKTLRDSKSIPVRISFVTIMTVLLCAYFYSESKFVFGSAISANSGVMTILRLKKYFFVTAYSLFAFYLLFYHLIKTKYRELILVLMVLFFFILKIFPFFLEKRAEMVETGEDYNLNESYTVLNKVFSSDDKIITNIHCYKVYYYASWYMIPNDEISPEFRIFPEKFPTLCYRFNPGDEKLLDKIDSDSLYILYVNEKNASSINLKNFLDQNKNNISLIKEELRNNNETLWSVWKYKK